MKNSTVLETTRGKTSFFSCEYRPGATKAHTCHSTNGKASKKADISKILSGTMKGEITDVAISVAPFGQMRHQRRRQKVVERPGPGKKNSRQPPRRWRSWP
jgi:hypothetical protein